MAECSTPKKILSKLGGKKVLHSQTREAIFNVYKFMKEEADHGIQKKVTAVNERVCQATGTSLSSLKRIIKEGETNLKEGKSFTTPNKIRKRNSKCVLDDFDKCALRRIIHNFRNNMGELPTLKTLLPLVRSDLNFSGGTSTLRKIIRSMGFRWRKTKNNRRVLIEKEEIRAKRIAYLRAIKGYRQQGRRIVYVDETYIHSTHTKPCSWSDDSNEMLTLPVSKGPRAVIVHAGGREGFVKNAMLIFKSGAKSGDYHDDMNFDNFYKWLSEKLIPNLQPNSVIVLDNAPYHNKVLNPAPTSSSTKEIMIEWLVQKGIPVSTSMLKPEIYSIVKTHKPSFQQYKIDALLSEYGHSVLRLPPYHPDLNPIELIWSTLKNYVAKKNTTYLLNDAIKLLEEKEKLITAEDWLLRCEKVCKLEDEYLQSEHFVDNMIEQFIIAVNSDNSEDDSFSDEDSDCGSDV